MSEVFLVPVSEEHAPWLQKLASDPAISDTTRLPSPYPDNGARQWIQYVVPRHAAGTEYAFSIFAGTEIVGVIGFTDLDGQNRSAEFGYWIGKPFWGRGLASEAGSRALRFIFEATDTACVTAMVLDRNLASRRVLGKLGFGETGVSWNEHPEHAPGEPARQYRLTRDQWRALKDG